MSLGTRILPTENLKSQVEVNMLINNVFPLLKTAVCSTTCARLNLLSLFCPVTESSFCAQFFSSIVLWVQNNETSERVWGVGTRSIERG